MTDISSEGPIPAPIASPLGRGLNPVRSIADAFNNAKGAVTRFGSGRAAALLTVAALEIVDAKIFIEWPDHMHMSVATMLGAPAAVLAYGVYELITMRDYHENKYKPSRWVSPPRRYPRSRKRPRVALRLERK